MNYQIHGTSVGSLLRAVNNFENFRKNLGSKQLKAGAIQSFKCCYELAWKTMRRLLAQKGIEVNSPRETFRAAALEKMIADAEIWFEFLAARNLTVHTYNEKQVELVLEVFEHFSHQIKDFLQRIGADA